jgi:hypothetical protein
LILRTTTVAEVKMVVSILEEFETYPARRIEEGREVIILVNIGIILEN